MLFLHNALKHALKSIEYYSFNGFILQCSRFGSSSCFPEVVWYCANILDVKTFCAVKYILSISKLFHRLLSALEDFQTMTHRHFRYRSDTASVRENVTERKTKIEGVECSRDAQKVHLYKKTIEDTLNDKSLARW